MGHDMTPETLRQAARDMLWDEEGVSAEMFAAADAWEAEHVKLMQFMVGANKLQDYIEGLEKRLEAAEKALREIAEGKGRFSRDPLTHASNTVEDMKALAVAAIAGEEKP